MAESFRNIPNPFSDSIKKIPLEIGNYRVVPTPTGIFGLDGGAMFGTVPKVLWQKTNPSDELNRIPMEARTLLLISDQHKILIDTGIGGDFVAKYGDKLGSKFAEMYAVTSEGATLMKSLKAAGVTPDEITHVILTHLHFDHVGGAVTEKDGKIVPTFKNAKHYIQKTNLDTAMKPNRREKASYFSINYQTLLDHNLVETVDGSVENLLPGISVGISNGHTLGQQYVRVSDGNKTLYFCADLIPTATHVRLPWVMGYDLRPLDLMAEKLVVLEQAVKENAYLFFEHDPYHDMVTVQEDRGDFAVNERFCILQD